MSVRMKAKDDPASLRATREYLIYFDQAPDLGQDAILKTGSEAAFAGAKK